MHLKTSLNILMGISEYKDHFLCIFEKKLFLKFS